MVVEAFSRRHCSVVTGIGNEAGWERDKLNETLAISSWYAPIPPSSKLTQIARTYETEGLDSGPNRAFLQPAFALSSPPRTINHHHFTFSHLYSWNESPTNFSAKKSPLHVLSSESLEQVRQHLKNLRLSFQQSREWEIIV